MNISRQASKYFLLGVVKASAGRIFKEVFDAECRLVDDHVGNIFKINVYSTITNLSFIFDLSATVDCRIYLEYNKKKTLDSNSYVEFIIRSKDEIYVTEIEDIIKKCFSEIKFHLKV